MNFASLRRGIALIIAALLFTSCAPSSSVAEPAAPTKLSENGRALLPIIISPQAGDREKTAAHTLAQYLNRISGGDFKVTMHSTALTPQTPGIVMGTANRFTPAFPQFRPDDPTATEDYLLRSHEQGLLLIGAGEMAVEHALWDLLYRLGHRQFFSGKNWEVVPAEQNLQLAVDSFEHPDYYSRSIWYGFGVLPENRANYDAWNIRNRARAGIRLNTGHAYDTIIERHKDVFEKHPEYLTRPRGNKFCVSAPGLQQFIVNYALAQFEKNPNLHSLSMEPSDGGGWQSDSCRDAQIYNSVTDRVVSLANLVAEAVAKKFPGKYIGIYAYNEHSPPPTIQVHPNVIVSIGTGFIQGGFTFEQLIAGWKEKGARLGVRNFYGVSGWDRDLPGRSQGSNISYITRTIPQFHSYNAHFLSSESSDSWGPNGLGFYLAARLMWDVDEAKRVEELKADFLQKAFGPAQEPMTEFYRRIDGTHKPLLSNDLIGRMYRLLDKALESTQDPAIVARLHDLTLYTRYVELFSAYSQAGGTARQAAFEQLMRYCWRIRTTEMVHTLALWRDLAARDKSVKFPPGVDYLTPESQTNWKSSEPYTPEQIQDFIIQGIANNALLDFEPAAFSDELVPATPLRLTSGRPGTFNLLRGTQNFYTWVESAPATINFQVVGGHLYTTRGPVRLELYPDADVEMKSAASVEVAPDKTPHALQLPTPYSGLHRFSISDSAAGTSIRWPAGKPLTVESSPSVPVTFTSRRWTMYFYVPKGTQTVGGYRSGTGSLLDPTGRVALQFTAQNNPGYWSVPVAPGQDGKLWQLSAINGQVRLMTVPPYLARSAAELLLPREVVEADSTP